MSVPVKARCAVDHRGADTAHQHRDVGAPDVGAHRAGALSASDERLGEPVQLPLLRCRLCPDVLPETTQHVLESGIACSGLDVTTQQLREHRERLTIAFERLARVLAEEPELLSDELDHQRLFGRKVSIDRADADGRALRDVVDLRIRATLGKYRPRAFEDALVIAPGVGSQLPAGLGLSRRHRFFTGVTLTSGIIVHYIDAMQAEPEVSFL